MVVTKADTESCSRREGLGPQSPVLALSLTLEEAVATGIGEEQSVQILSLSGSGKQRMTKKECVKFLCWMYLHPKGCFNLLLFGQATRSCMADGERVPQPCSLVFHFLPLSTPG